MRLLFDGLSVRDAMNDWDDCLIRRVLQNDCPHVILDWGRVSGFVIVFLIRFFLSKLSVVPRVERRIDFYLEWTGSFSFIGVIAMALECLDVAHKFVVVVAQRQQNADDPLKHSLFSDVAASKEKMTMDVASKSWPSLVRVVVFDLCRCGLTSKAFIFFLETNCAFAKFRGIRM